ncbi:nucleotidyltransferase domain-containing protein [Candidatus Woesearchaeota archaeon]|nr:nucleotidyltransferase domain-containing protein [Candidatus Woesearchaeota archaeon]
MKFKIQRRDRPRIEYPQEDLRTAREYANRLYKEFGDFVKAIILFGSVARKEKAHDIDILVVLDDVSVILTPEIVETYRIIDAKILRDVDPNRLHIQSMKLTSFWEYVRSGDAVAINVLRYGIALIDTGFFDPLQRLLDLGRIRPTTEAIYTYYSMAPASMIRSRQHLLSAVVDLYLAAIDSCHAALMKIGEIPPSPEHVANMVNHELVKRKLVEQKTAEYMNNLYNIFKKITHREVKFITGKEYDQYIKMADFVVRDMRKFLEKKVTIYK